MITSGRLPTMQILVLIGTVGASPHIGEILPLCDFLFFLSCCCQTTLLKQFGYQTKQALLVSNYLFHKCFHCRVC